MIRTRVISNEEERVKSHFVGLRGWMPSFPRDVGETGAKSAGGENENDGEEGACCGVPGRAGSSDTKGVVDSAYLPKVWKQPTTTRTHAHTQAKRKDRPRRYVCRTKQDLRLPCGGLQRLFMNVGNLTAPW